MEPEGSDPSFLRCKRSVLPLDDGPSSFASPQMPHRFPCFDRVAPHTKYIQVRYRGVPAVPVPMVYVQHLLIFVVSTLPTRLPVHPKGSFAVRRMTILVVIWLDCRNPTYSLRDLLTRSTAKSDTASGVAKFRRSTLKTLPACRALQRDTGSPRNVATPLGAEPPPRVFWNPHLFGAPFTTMLVQDTPLAIVPRGSDGSHDPTLPQPASPMFFLKKWCRLQELNPALRFFKPTRIPTTPKRHYDFRLVGVAGFEPAIPCSQSRCPSRWATPRSS